MATLLITLLYTTQIADWLLTVHMLGMGGRELNPLMAWLFSVSPFAPLVAKLAVATGVALLYIGADDKRLAQWVLVGFLALSLVPVVWNATQLW